MEQDCCLRIANEDISRNDGCSNNDMLESYIRSMAINLAKNVLHHNERCYSLMGRWILTGKIEEDDDCLVELGQLFSKRLWEHIDRDGK